MQYTIFVTPTAMEDIAAGVEHYNAIAANLGYRFADLVAEYFDKIAELPISMNKSGIALTIERTCFFISIIKTSHKTAISADNLRLRQFRYLCGPWAKKNSSDSRR